ncbi:hypothetical protein D9M68_915200 [compost metagenome]
MVGSCEPHTARPSVRWPMSSHTCGSAALPSLTASMEARLPKPLPVPTLPPRSWANVTMYLPWANASELRSERLNRSIRPMKMV